MMALGVKIDQLRHCAQASPASPFTTDEVDEGTGEARGARTQRRDRCGRDGRPWCIISVVKTLKIQYWYAYIGMRLLFSGREPV
jgi:hypothetical protein